MSKAPIISPSQGKCSLKWLLTSQGDRAQIVFTCNCMIYSKDGDLSIFTCKGSLGKWIHRTWSWECGTSAIITKDNMIYSWVTSMIAFTASSISQQGQSCEVCPQSYTKTDVSICTERLVNLHLWSLYFRMCWTVWEKNDAERSHRIIHRHSGNTLQHGTQLRIEWGINQKWPRN